MKNANGEGKMRNEDETESANKWGRSTKKREAKIMRDQTTTHTGPGGTREKNCHHHHPSWPYGPTAYTIILYTKKNTFKQYFFSM
jgi:hypothetical protein